MNFRFFSFLVALLGIGSVLQAQTVRIDTVDIHKSSSGSFNISVETSSSYGFSILSVTSDVYQNKVAVNVCYTPNTATVFTRKDTAINVIPNLGFHSYEVKVRAIRSGAATYCTPQVVTDSSLTAFTITSLSADQIGTKDFKITPNPAKQIVSLSGFEGFNTITSISLLDLNGRLVKEYTPRQRKLNIYGLKSGLYIIKIQTKEAIISHKLVVE